MILVSVIGFGGAKMLRYFDNNDWWLGIAPNFFAVTFFAFIGLRLLLEFSQNHYRQIFITGLVLIVSLVVIYEFLQGYVTGYTFDPWDIVASLAAGGFSLIFFAVLDGLEAKVDHTSRN